MNNKIPTIDGEYTSFSAILLRGSAKSIVSNVPIIINTPNFASELY